jgi:hypothetical protein
LQNIIIGVFFFEWRDTGTINNFMQRQTFIYPDVEFFWKTSHAAPPEHVMKNSDNDLPLVHGIVIFISW